jgi:DNA polymerase/3'-5' exonuclease PolX
MGGKLCGGRRPTIDEAVKAMLSVKALCVGMYDVDVRLVGSARRKMDRDELDGTVGDVDLVIVRDVGMDGLSALEAAKRTVDYEGAMVASRMCESADPKVIEKSQRQYRSMIEKGEFAPHPLDVVLVGLFGLQKSKPVPAKSGLFQGVQVDVNLATHEDLGTQMMMWTGSKRENLRLRSRAMEMGLKLNQYGLWQGETNLTAGMSEMEVYARLGLPYVEPGQRE